MNNEIEKALGDDFLEEMHQAELAMYEADKKDRDRKNKIIKRIKRYLPECWFKQIEYCIEDSGWCTRFEIVKSTEGHEKQNDGYRFKVFVDQYCNGGYWGDEFAGTICIPIKNGNYLKFHYSM